MPIDLAGFITDVKMHAVRHRFHVHAERHYIESYSLFQHWEVDLHPEQACSGPMEMQMVLEADPRVLLAFEDLAGQSDLEEMQDKDSHPFHLPLFFKWSLPPLTRPPDLLILSTDLAGVAGTTIPIEVSAIDTYMSVTDPATRSLSMVGVVEISLREMITDDLNMCQVLDCAHEVSTWLLDQSQDWFD